jgi:hypothetical protein
LGFPFSTVIFATALIYPVDVYGEKFTQSNIDIMKEPQLRLTHLGRLSEHEQSRANCTLDPPVTLNVTSEPGSAELGETDFNTNCAFVI